MDWDGDRPQGPVSCGLIGGMEKKVRLERRVGGLGRGVLSRSKLPPRRNLVRSFLAIFKTQVAIGT